MLVTSFVLFFGLLTSLTTDSTTVVGQTNNGTRRDGLQYTIYMTTTTEKHPRKLIAVNLTWSAPLNKSVTGHDVIINPLAKDNSSICEQKDFLGSADHLPGRNVTSVNVIFEKNRPFVPIFYFGCKYFAEVLSLPRGFSYHNTTINIPELLDGGYSGCKDDLPPVINTTVKSVVDSSWTVNTSWIYNSNISIRYFKLSYAKRISAGKKHQHQVYKWITVNKTMNGKYSELWTLNSAFRHKISVYAMDEHHCNSSASVFVECTGNGVCTCLDENLPVPSNVEASYNYSSSYTKVHWQYRYYQDLNYFLIATNTGQYYSNISDLRTYVNSTDPHSFFILLPCDPSSVTTLSIRAVNRDGCYGLVSKEIFSKCRDELLFMTQNASMDGVIVSVIVLFVFALFVVLLVYKRKQLKRFINTKFKSPKEGFIGSAIIEYSRNLIYIEKEIQDARDQGLVDQFEINYHRLEFGKEIGTGAFGRVFVANIEALGLTSGKSTVAVKQLRDGASDLEIDDFKAEIAMMKQVGKHPHVVTMIGCCTMQQPYCMVMEYIPCGDLQRYLKKLRKEYVRRIELNFSGNPFSNECSPYISCGFSCNNHDHNDSSEYLLRSQTSSNMTNGTLNTSTYTIPEEDENLSSPEPEEVETLIEQYCVKPKPSDGYVVRNYVRLGTLNPPPVDTRKCSPEPNCLDSEELHMFALQIAKGMCHLASKGITHRDLAARNVLIDENHTLKISDFGLSRTGIYVTQRGGRVPLRWLSIEAIRDNLYSMESDVWAFGVVLWEICTLGGFPYANVSDAALLNYLVNDHRLVKPDNCADELYSIMEACWNEDPHFRPSFHDLRDLLDKMKGESHVYVNFDVATNRPLPPDESEVKKMKESSTKT